MPKSVHSLNQVSIASPCKADWESMVGDDQIRFCEHCQLHVNNLSAMTRPQALRFIAQSSGRLCVRYEQRTDGEIITKDFPTPLYRIARRASRIAATAFSATLSFSTVVAQGTARVSAPAEIVRDNAQRSAKTGGDARVSCTVTDPNGAVVPGAAVTLANDETSIETSMTVGDAGVCVFEKVIPGTYTLAVVTEGFKTAVVKDVEIQAGGNRHLEVQLEIQSSYVTVGMVAIVEPKDPLPLYAHKNDLNMVARLALLTANINAPDQSTEINPLAYAIENHNLDMVRVLLSAGANINAANKRGRTPLMYLSSEASKEFVGELIAAGADATASDDAGDTVLMTAARSCSLPIVQQMLAAGARSDTVDSHGNTLLMNAAQNADAAVFKFVLGTGVDATAGNEDGESALTIAVNSGKSQNIQALLDAGVTFDQDQEELNDSLIGAVNGNDVETVRLLLKAGASPNAKQNDSTALMRAAMYGKAETMKVLIDAGADLDTTDDDGDTALMYAADVEKVGVLLKAGVDVRVKNKDGKTAFALAIEHHLDDIANVLKSRGAPQ